MAKESTREQIESKLKKVVKGSNFKIEDVPFIVFKSDELYTVKVKDGGLKTITDSPVDFNGAVVAIESQLGTE